MFRISFKLIFAVFIFLLLIRNVGELRAIPSNSMAPTLIEGDRVVIDRMSSMWRPYQRGDIFVFYPPDSVVRHDPISMFLRASGLSAVLFKKEDRVDVAYIKRIIGLPGDSVEVKPADGVYVNGKRLNEPYVAKVAKSCTFVLPAPNCGSVIIPPKQVFFLGDNRNESADSRYFGFVDVDRLIGRAVYRYDPEDRVGAL